MLAILGLIGLAAAGLAFTSGGEAPEDESDDLPDDGEVTTAPIDLDDDDLHEGGAGDDPTLGLDPDEYPGETPDEDDDRPLHGDDADDSLTGSDGDDILLGAGGNDDLDGGFGDDWIDGGDGDDVIAGGAGHDQVTGGAGADTLSGGDGDDYLSGDDGGEASADVIDGGDGDDVIDLGSGDIATGGAGADFFQRLVDGTDAGPAIITDYDSASDSLVILHDDDGPAPELDLREDDEGTAILADGAEVAYLAGVKGFDLSQVHLVAG